MASDPGACQEVMDLSEASAAILKDMIDALLLLMFHRGFGRPY